MIQELYFAPHSKSRSLNQMNTSVTLRYDTKTEKLQLVDVFGKAKNITIDTDPNDLTPEGLTGIITTDFVKGLGFETAEETAAKIPSVDTGYGLGVNLNDTTYTVYLKKSVITGIVNEQVTPDKVRSYFSEGSGILLNEGQIKVDTDFFDGRVDDILAEKGYVTIDNDHVYHADEETLTLTVTPVEPTEDNPSGVTNTFSINQEWLSGFVSGFLGEADIIPLSAGEGINIENIEVEGQETNVISLTAHIPSGVCDVWTNEQNIADISGLGFIQIGDVPVYTAGVGIEIDDNQVVSLTAHIPTGVCDVWADGQNITDIYGLGFALRSELHDTLYYADNISLTLNSDDKIFSINQEWLSTFVESFNYLTSYVDTTYIGSDSINISGDTNIISVNETWLGQAAAPIIIQNITTDQGVAAVKSIITKDYISGLGFVLTDSDEDTKYYAAENGGLTLVSTDFSIDTDWLSGKVGTYIDNKVTSTFIADIGVKITDTTSSPGLGVMVEEDPNGNPQIQMISVDPDWVAGQISAFNEANHITGFDIVAGSGISVVDNPDSDYSKIVSLTAVLPTAGTGLSAVNDNTFIINTEWLEGFVANLGYIKVDNDTIYHADENTIVMGANNTFSVNSSWLNGVITGYGYLVADDLADYAQLSDIPTKVSDLPNDAGYITGYENTTYSAGDASLILNGTSFKVFDLQTRFEAGENITITPVSVTEGNELLYFKLKIDATVPSALSDIGTASGNTQYISSLGFVLAGDDKDTKYGVVANGGLTIDLDHNFAVDGTWMSNQLTPYALIENVPTKISDLEDDVLSAYAKVEDVPVKVGQLVNDKSYATLADIEAIRLNILQQIGNLTFVSNVTEDITQPNNNLFIENADPLTVSHTFTAKNITVNALSNENCYSKFVATGDISLNNLTNSGNLPDGTQFIISTPGRVSVTDSTLNQTGVIAFKIGLNSSIEPPKSVFFDNVKFKGTLSNNAINIYGNGDDAVITINKCTFARVKNAIRISNRTNKHLTVNIVNCKFNTWSSGAEGGMIVCQDYTSQTAIDVEQNNLFSPEKVSINIINCTHNGAPILPVDDLSTVCGSGDENQLLYVTADEGGGVVAYGDGSRYPKLSIQ